MHHQFQNILELLHVFERNNIREREKKFKFHSHS
jgi:hypothetical protein